MAALTTDYDLSTGDGRTTNKITGATNVDVETNLGTVLGRVIFYHEKRNDSSESWKPIHAGESKRPAAFSTLDEVDDSDTLQGLAAAEYSIRIVPVGTATLEVTTDGTVAAI